MLELVFEMIIMGHLSKCIDYYENIKLDVMSSTFKKFYTNELPKEEVCCCKSCEKSSDGVGDDLLSAVLYKPQSETN